VRGGGACGWALLAFARGNNLVTIVSRRKSFKRPRRGAKWAAWLAAWRARWLLGELVGALPLGAGKRQLETGWLVRARAGGP